MEIRFMTTAEGVFIRRDDVVELLRTMGNDYLQHVPGHSEVGEFIEAAMDRHADYILGQAANYFEKELEEPANG